ncbi:MAG TPA: 3-oxoadipate enol-lactonase [Vicinamibacterales bacterium]|jgi:3-oxoadipate enol-lactonase/4-carboxymuconolactone decarboxylase|nr:3-oxoadipate enol-lactonase [Vicinamibacterales bacterium]
MPLLTIGDTTVYYRLEGGDDRPVLMLSHSLGQDHGMWDPQAADLAAHFCVLRYDIRGHGASGVTPGGYRIEQLGADALALADALGIDHFAFCGLSLGGMIGQWLAAHAADRVDAVILANTSARADSAGMETRRQAVLTGGMPAVADVVMRRFFSPQLLDASAPAVATARRTLLATDPAGYAGCCAAIRDMDLTATLGAIRAPVLIISGDLDVSLPWTGHGDALARGIAHARVVHLPTAHLSNLEAPRSFTAALMDFLLPPAANSLDAGLAVRRRVLGDAHVDNALASAPSAAFQDLITRYAWGTIWTRPLLDIRTRRLLILAMTAAMGRWDEFRLHVRTGLVHELEWCDLEEVLLQTAIYAGIPAANTALHIASEERGEPVR